MSETIILGGQEFTLAPFTFEQLKTAMTLFDAAAKPLAEGGFEASRAIIELALTGQITPEALSALSVRLDEVIGAVRRIGLVSGLLMEVPRGKPGGEPEAAGASIGTPYMPQSPQTPDGAGPISED